MRVESKKISDHISEPEVNQQDYLVPKISEIALPLILGVGAVFLTVVVIDDTIYSVANSETFAKTVEVTMDLFRNIF